MSEFVLNAFQQKTVDHILDYYKDHNVYLLADETGLGKTIIASEVARRLTQGSDKTRSVLYIASSLDLAKENIRKLEFEGSYTIEGRLSMLWKESKKEERTGKVRLFALTPAVSLRMTTDGTDPEREQCKTEFYRLQTENTVHFDDSMTRKIKSIAEQMVKLKGRVEGNYIERVKKREDQYYTELNRHSNKSTKLFKKISGDDSSKVYGDIGCSYELDKDFTTLAQEMIAIYLQDIVWPYMQYPNQDKTLDPILKLEAVKKAVSSLYPDDSNEIGKKYIDILWYNSKQTVTDNLYENPREIVEKMAKKIRANWSKIEDEIRKTDGVYKKLLRALYNIYSDDYHKLIRCCMAHYSLTSFVNPDVVIIDEIQNYPSIFSKEENPDDESAIIQEVLNEVLGRKKDSGDKKNVKVLMLSATPYAYKNAIETDDKDPGDAETDTFTKHLVGMDDILGYMKEQNNCTAIDVIKDWKYVQEKLRELSESSKDNLDEPLFEEAKNAVTRLSDNMLAIGISRSERPKKTYKPDGGRYTISQVKVSEFANYFTKSKPIGTRLALSVPRNIEANELKTGYERFDDKVKKIGIEGEVSVGSSRIEALIADLFDGNLCQFLFIPPNRPSHPLKGIYENSERKYGKTLLFSAYNAVPEFLKSRVNVLLEKKLIEKSGWSEAEFYDKSELLKGRIPSFENYRNDSNEQIPDTIAYQDKEADGDKHLLYSVFTSEYAQKVILSLYKDKAISDYGQCLDDYCINGNLDAVMEEFKYMCSIQKKTPKPEDCLEIKDNAEAKGFSVAYGKTSMGDLEDKIRAFNNPFYPFAFFITSMAEEGHDFHWYSDRIVHWNVPASPISLIQREGRIDRADCFSIRKAIAEEMKDCDPKMKWEELIEAFKESEKDNIKSELYKEMFPKFITSEAENKIHRMCYYYPLSNEYFRWEILMKNLEFYRSMFGACDNEDISSLKNVLDETAWDRLKCLELDLHIR